MAYSSGKIFIPDVSGNIVISVTAQRINPPVYTNQIPISTDESGNIYNGTGYKNDHRINSSGVEDYLAGAVLTGYIPVHAGDTIRVLSGYLDPNWSSAGSARSRLYKSDKSGITSITHNSMASSAFLSNVVTDGGGYITQFDIAADKTDVAFIRLTMKGTGENAVATVNEEL